MTMDDAPTRPPPAPPRFRPPGVGLVLVVLALAALAAFLVFGLRRPEGDRLWRILHQLKIGNRPRLGAGDVRLLEGMLARYPELGPALRDDRPAGLISAHTDGWAETPRAYLLADAGAGADPVVTLFWRPEEGAPEGPVVLEGGGARLVALEGPGSVTLALPHALRARQLVCVRLAPPDGREGKGVAAGLKIVFEGEARTPP